MGNDLPAPYFVTCILVKTDFGKVFALRDGGRFIWRGDSISVISYEVSSPYVCYLPDDVKAGDFFSPDLPLRNVELRPYQVGRRHICEDFLTPRTFSKMLSLPVHPMSPRLPYREMFKDRYGEGNDRILVITQKGYEIWRLRDADLQRFGAEVGILIPFLFYDLNEPPIRHYGARTYLVLDESWRSNRYGFILNGNITAPFAYGENKAWMGKYLLPSDAPPASEIYIPVRGPWAEANLDPYFQRDAKPIPDATPSLCLLPDVASLEERSVNPQWGEPRLEEYYYHPNPTNFPFFFKTFFPCLMRNPEVPWWSDVGQWDFYNVPEGVEARVEVYHPLSKESVTIPPGPITAVASVYAPVPKTWTLLERAGDFYPLRPFFLYDEGFRQESGTWALYKVQGLEGLDWWRGFEAYPEFSTVLFYPYLVESKRRSLVPLSAFRTKSRELKDVHYIICQRREVPLKAFLAARSIKFEEPPDLHSILLGGRHISGPLTGVVRKVKWVEVDSRGREVQEEKVELSVLFCGEDSEGPKESAPYVRGFFAPGPFRIGLAPAEASYAAQNFGTGYVTERCIAATSPLFPIFQPRLPYMRPLDVTDPLFMVHPREMMPAYVLPLVKSLLLTKLKLSDKLKGLDITDWLAKKGISVAKKRWWSFMEEPEEIKEEVHLDERWHGEELQCITVSVGWRYLLTYAVIPNYEGLPPILLLFLSEYDEKGEPVAVALLDATYMKELGT